MKLNNKGYMLVEIILASTIAFALAYFIMDLTIKMKNKNDDLLVETFVETDRAIIANEIMEYMINENINFTCAISKEGNKIYYKGKDNVKKEIDIVTKYANIGTITCRNESNNISLSIEIRVEQMSDKNFNVVLNYRY